MHKNDEFNIEYVKSDIKADAINKTFYEKFNYPWPPSSLLSIQDNGLINILNQDIGDFTHSRIPQKAKIWIAGCGTNQALITALRFPQAEVLGTDISTVSLHTCYNNAKSIGVNNLRLEAKSINDVSYNEEFDYVISTGVIHHNSDPKQTLNKISRALKKEGILELMVYNYYHRIMVTAFQKGIRKLIGSKNILDFDKEVEVAERLIKNFPQKNLMAELLTSYKNAHIAEMADALLQPIESNYTVNTLNELVQECNLKILLPCINQFDKATNTYDWNLQFADPELTDMYDRLPDIDRWQVTNLFKLNYCPLLWFYMQRQDSSYERKSEKDACESFLKSKFKRFSTDVTLYSKTAEGSYQPVNSKLKFPNPLKPLKSALLKIYESVSPEMQMDEVLAKMGLTFSFAQLNEIRINLTTSAFPYLISV